jgi:hypothetical protein
VTSIALVTIDWGSISVSGGSASATSYETWTTQLADGSTMQSRDQNDYSLVQENGAWKIATNTHEVGCQPARLAEHRAAAWVCAGRQSNRTGLGNLKSTELANPCSDSISEVATIADDGLDRIGSDAALCFAFLRHCGLSL